MSLFDSAKDILTGERMPRALQRAIASVAVTTLGLKFSLDEFLQSHRKPRAEAPAGTLHFVDGYHGGVVFWDWIGLAGGGLWRVYNWPLCLKPVIKRAVADDRFRVVLDLDAYTYEWMEENDEKAITLLQRGIRKGRIEPVNGTYAQPFSAAESGESFLRQLDLGMQAVDTALDATVDTFYSQEPAYFPQLPQLLKKCGYRLIVFRTQWAPFGTDPGYDADVVSWGSPDGSVLPTVPRYTFQDYRRQLEDHPGLAAGSLSMGDIPDCAPESLAPFEKAARARGIEKPIVTDLKDPNIPDAPLARAEEIARMENVRFTTFGEYRENLHTPEETRTFGLDDIPCTLPWGLQGDAVPKGAAAAESALHTAERVDAVAYALDGTSEEGRLTDAWKSLCLAQHHDLYVCGPWHSRAHRGPMSDVSLGYSSSAREAAEAIIKETMSRLAETFSGDVIVFNPVGRERMGSVEFSVPHHELSPDAGGYSLSDGTQTYPCQVVSKDENCTRMGAVVPAPSLGVAGFMLVPGAGGTDPEKPPRVSLDDSLHVEVSGGAQPVIRNAAGECVAEGPFFTCHRDGVLHDSRSSINAVTWIDDGPVFRRLEIRGSIAGIPLVHTLTMYHGIGRIDGRVRFDFGEDGVFLGPRMEDTNTDEAYSIQDERKLCLCLVSPYRDMYCASPFWAGKMKGHRAAGASWAGLKGKNRRGIALINRGTRGYHLDRAGGAFRNVLAWGPREWIYASRDSITRGRSPYTALTGTHEYEYSIAPYPSHAGAFLAAECSFLPLRARWNDGGDRGGLPSSWSALSVESTSVIVTAFLVRNGALHARVLNASDDTVNTRIGSDLTGKLCSVPLGFDGTADELPGGRISLDPWGVRSVRIGT